MKLRVRKPEEDLLPLEPTYVQPKRVVVYADDGEILFDGNIPYSPRMWPGDSVDLKVPLIYPK